jgi:hypothetical protein
MSLLPTIGAVDQDTGFYNGVATQSLRFNDDDDAYLSRTPSSASQSTTNKKTWTYSTWFKIANTGANHTIWSAGATGTPRVALYLSSGGQLITDLAQTGTYDQSVALFRDPSAWYHLVWAFDTTQATGSNRSRIYINGKEITLTKTRTWSLNTDYAFNGTVLHTIGGLSNSLTAFSSDKYQAETNFIDGTAIGDSDADGYLDEFGELKNGVWIPKEYTGSYGTNGFRLQFNQTGTGTGSTTTVGADSANSNHFDSSSIDTEDCAMPDSPENNFATFNPLYATENANFSEGNLKLSYSSGTFNSGGSTISTGSMKFYTEVIISASTANPAYAVVGVVDADKFAWNTDNANPATGSNGVGYFLDTGAIVNGYGTNGTGATLTTGDILGIACDPINGTVAFYKNGSLQDTLTITTGLAYNVAMADTSRFTTDATFVVNYGQDPSFAGYLDGTIGKEVGTETPSEGAGVFKHAVPSGYLALCSANLEEPTISPNADTQAEDNFTPIVYTGNTTDNHLVPASGDTPDSISFAPDWIWIKNRDVAHAHILIDSVRGVNAGYLTTINTNTESGNNSLVKTIETSSPFGFTLGTAGAVNSTDDLVAWVWKAGGTAVLNEQGSINSNVSANTDAGFSIVSYTGTGASFATIGHGLDAVPKVLIVKNRDASYNWKVYHESIGNTKYLVLDNSDQAQTATSHWNDTTPDENVFTIGSSNALIRLNDNFVAYCFAEVEGYSKFGSYEGNLDTDGTFVYTGFKPAWVMIKDADTNGYNWYMYDNLRKPYNNNSIYLIANGAGLEIDYAGDSIDHLSNGFKLRTLANGRGTNRAVTYIYMAFAEAPFKYANAR